MSSQDLSIKPVNGTAALVRQGEERLVRPAHSAAEPTGVDDGWDSATGTPWATELTEPGEAVRRQAWKEHSDQIARQFAYNREKADANDAPHKANDQGDGEGIDNAGEALATDRVMTITQESQVKLGLRSLRAADPTSQHSLRASQVNTDHLNPNRIDPVDASTTTLAFNERQR